MLNIDEANQLLREHIKDQKNLYHSRETEVIMRALAKHFNEDEEKWGITGLLHDLDWEATEATPEQHGIKSTELIGDKLPEDAIHAIQSHNQGYTGIKRESNFDICLAAGESITGIISAYALVRPDKKIAGTKVKSITKKLKDKYIIRRKILIRSILLKE